MRKNIRHAATTPALVLALFISCVAMAHAQEQQGGRADASVATPTATRLPAAYPFAHGADGGALPAEPPRESASARPAGEGESRRPSSANEAPRGHVAEVRGGRPRVNLGAVVFRRTGLRLLVATLRGEAEKNTSPAQSSDAGAAISPLGAAAHQNGNYLMPYPNERRSATEPYRPHN